MPNVSLYTKINDTRPNLRFGLSFDQLLTVIGPPVPYVAKDDAPLFSACEYRAGHGPNKDEKTKYVVCGHFGVADLDGKNHEGVPEDLLLRCLTRLKQDDIPFRVVSSWSHTGKDNRYSVRVIFPFSRPVLVSEWGLLWERIQTRIFEGAADKSCKDITRRYYCPAIPEGSGITPVDESWLDGKRALDVDSILGSDAARGPLLAEGEDAAPGAVAASGGIKLTRDHLRRVRDQLAGSRTPARRDLAPVMSKLINGEALAETGDRHGLLFRLVAEILDRYPHADPESMLVHFAQSISVMPGKSLDEVLAMITNKQAEPKARLSSRMREARTSTQNDPAAIADMGYTQEALDAMYAELGTTPEDIAHQWIIQKGDSYYVLCNGQYHCYTGLELGNAVLRDLAPAIACGVDLNEVTSQGIRPKKTAELMRDYGQVAREVIVDMREQRTRFDQARATMIEAPCPIVVGPKHHEEVDLWLRLLAGPKYEDKLRQWVAAFSRLGEPCAALYLEGEKGTGKSLLATGLSAAFGREPTTLEQAFESFNEALMRCPIVLSDEKVPKDLQGRVQTDTMREFIQARSRPLKRKFKPDATLYGCTRLIIAANNKNLLSTTEHLTEHDISAIVERFLHIPAQAEARAYLLDQNIVQWVEEKWIAEHALWLAENLEIPVTSRFLVSGDATALTNELATSTGLRAGVCEWLVNYLILPNKIQSDHLRDLVRVKDGQLYVQSRLLQAKWAEYVQTKRDPPTPSALAKALAGLSREASVRGQDPRKPPIKMRHVNLDMLIVWAEETNFSDERTLREKLRYLEESTATKVN